MQPVNLLTPSELNWLDVCDSLRCVVSRFLVLRRFCSLRLLFSLFGSQLLQTPFTGSLAVLMKCCTSCDQHVSLFSLWYLMVPPLRVFDLQPGVRGALQAKY